MCVRVCAQCVGILLVLICNRVAPSPFPDKWCYLAASDAGITVMNDTVHINIAPPPLLHNAALMTRVRGIISPPHLPPPDSPLNLSLSHSLWSHSTEQCEGTLCWIQRRIEQSHKQPRLPDFSWRYKEASALRQIIDVILGGGTRLEVQETSGKTYKPTQQH